VIRTRNPKKRAAADARLRPRGTEIGLARIKIMMITKIIINFSNSLHQEMVSEFKRRCQTNNAVNIPVVLSAKEFIHKMLDPETAKGALSKEANSSFKCARAQFTIIGMLTVKE
jgi:hypothetical protein